MSANWRVQFDSQIVECYGENTAMRVAQALADTSDVDAVVEVFRLDAEGDWMLSAGVRPSSSLAEYDWQVRWGDETVGCSDVHQANTIATALLNFCDVETLVEVYQRDDEHPAGWALHRHERVENTEAEDGRPEQDVDTSVEGIVRAMAALLLDGSAPGQRIGVAVEGISDGIEVNWISVKGER